MDVKQKLTSRTWWLTVAWTAMVPAALVAQVLVQGVVDLPIGAIVASAGTLSVAYVGKRTLDNHDHTTKGAGSAE